MTPAEYQALIASGESVGVIGPMSGKAHRVSGSLDTLAKGAAGKGGSRRPRGKARENVKDRNLPTSAATADFTPSRMPHKAKRQGRQGLPMGQILALGLWLSWLLQFTVCHSR